jgi:hypothetical protein
VVEHLPSKCEALASNTVAPKRNKAKQKNSKDPKVRAQTLKLLEENRVGNLHDCSWDLTLKPQATKLKTDKCNDICMKDS